MTADGPSSTADALALARLIGSARRLLAFTGAGMSTGSGIPDFRGPQGVWQRRRPVTFQEFMSSETGRAAYWEYKAEGWELFRDARPNAAHLALVELERLGVLAAVVTQNIDGLHQAAGDAPGRVVVVHGTNRLVECTSCGRLEPPDEPVRRFRAEGACPTCGACGGWLKFATVSFGQALRPDVMQRAGLEASRADAVLALGSTLSVQPAAGIPLLAARRGAPYAIVNQGPTDQDELATLLIEGDVADVLPRAVAILID